nr:MAG TPA: protein of unknown function DUF4969 [Caudoviricetes sp.]
MKRFIGAVLCLVLTVFPLSACTPKTEVSREAIDHKYTAAYDSVETVYMHKYDALTGDFNVVPYLNTVHHDAKYEILYRITYDDGSAVTNWECVSKAEYERTTASQRRTTP